MEREMIVEALERQTVSLLRLLRSLIKTGGPCAMRKLAIAVCRGTLAS